jgi:uncharacterized protein
MKKKNEKKESTAWINYTLIFLLGAALAILVTASVLEIKPQQQQQQINFQTPQKTEAPVQSYAQTKQATVPVVAVQGSDDQGVVGNLTIQVIPGSGRVLMQTNSFSQPDLQYSANTAATVATMLAKDAGYDTSNEDIIYNYDINDAIVGGGSAGAISTLGTLAAIEGKTIRPDVILTGTINPDGTIGDVGGLPEKVQAAEAARYKIFLVPEGQSAITQYQQVIDKNQRSHGWIYYSSHLEAKTKDLKDFTNGTIQIKEVRTVEDAEKYIFA